MTNPTIASAPRAAGAMKTIPSLRVRIARAHLLASLLLLVLFCIARSEEHNV